MSVWAWRTLNEPTESKEFASADVPRWIDTYCSDQWWSQHCHVANAYSSKRRLSVPVSMVRQCEYAHRHDDHLRPSLGSASQVDERSWWSLEWLVGYTFAWPYLKRGHGSRTQSSRVQALVFQTTHLDGVLFLRLRRTICHTCSSQPIEILAKKIDDLSRKENNFFRRVD